MSKKNTAPPHSPKPLQDWLDKNPRGSLKLICGELEVTPQTLTNWLNPKRGIPAGRWPAVEAYLKGQGVKIEPPPQASKDMFLTQLLELYGQLSAKARDKLVVYANGLFDGESIGTSKGKPFTAGGRRRSAKQAAHA